VIAGPSPRTAPPAPPPDGPIRTSPTAEWLGEKQPAIRREDAVFARVLCLGGAVLIGLGLPVAVPARAEWDAVRVLIGPAGDTALHVMSFNLRFASDSGPDSWPRRRPVMAELLRAEQPTVIGTQEGLYQQLKDIGHDLPDYYDWIGMGRAGGSRDEFGAVFYDSRRLEPMDFDYFWLSDTPDVIGSKSWGNGLPRMVTQVHFADKHTGAEFVLFNTHLDHQSEEARVRGAVLIRDRINAVDPSLPVVLTGDFNGPAGSSVPYDVLVNTGGLADTWTRAADRRTPAYVTFHGFGPPVPGDFRIDWILTRGAVTTEAAGINVFARDGQYPSDHFPMQALITIAAPAG
jgi:endonuclease/exonuclease/phosphatase family metal-dependent hydrolase